MNGIFNPTRDNILPFHNYNRMASGLLQNYDETIDYYQKQNKCSRSRAQPKILNHQTNDPDDPINDPRLNLILNRDHHGHSHDHNHHGHGHGHSHDHNHHGHNHRGCRLGEFDHTTCGCSPKNMYLPAYGYENFELEEDESGMCSLVTQRNVLLLMALIVILSFLFFYTK
jgi:hypothetical protein